MAQRIYDNRNREESARNTRRRVLAAAHLLFLDRGYAATTIAAVAQQAAVSPQTVYGQFGGKAGLLKAVYDVTLAGDDEDLPMAERPEFRRMAAANDLEELLVAYTSLVRDLVSRLGPMLPLIYGSRAVEPDLDALALTAAQERRFGARAFAANVVDRGLTRSGLDKDTVADLVWVLNSPETYLLLRQSSGLDDDAYQAWLLRALRATLG